MEHPAEPSRILAAAAAATLAPLARPEDAGLGDTVHRLAVRFGLEAATRYAAAMGINCGCPERRARWNRAYPWQWDRNP